MANQEPARPLPSVRNNPNRRGAELPEDAEQPQVNTLPSARRPMLPPLNNEKTAASAASIRANPNRRGAELPGEE